MYGDFGGPYSAPPPHWYDPIVNFYNNTYWHTLLYLDQFFTGSLTVITTSWGEARVFGFSMLIAIALFGLLAWWGLDRPGKVRRVILFVSFLLSIPLSAFAFSQVLGTPVPLIPYLFEPPTGSFTVAAVKMIPNEGIYFVLDMGEFEPLKYYKLPWNAKTADGIQSAMNAGGRLIFRKGKTLELDDVDNDAVQDDPKFYTTKIKARPPEEKAPQQSDAIDGNTLKK